MRSIIETKAKDFFNLLKKNKKKLIVVESCTGGLFSSIFTSIPGSSKVFHFGLITYSNFSKHFFCEVSYETLEKFGAVSEEVARDMSKNLYNKINQQNTISISCTGIAGPSGGNENKPVGTVYISFHYTNKNITFHKKFFNLKRIEIQLKTVEFMIEEGMKIINS